MNKKKFIIFLICFVAINLLLYIFIQLFHQKIPFDNFNYSKNAHHYFIDQRSVGGNFNILRALGQYDAQWYLKIADSGYPSHPRAESLTNKRIMGGETYAFFPLYPLLLSTLNIFLENIEHTAFIFANILLLTSFASLYYLITKLYKEQTAIKTIFLIFLFPFSIFYRSFFTEGLFLVGLIWFSYFLIKKHWLPASFILGYLIITRPTGFFLLPVFFYFFYKHLVNRQKTIISNLLILAVAVAPFFLWMFYCYVQTGNALYFYSVRREWFTSPFPFIYNLGLISRFFELPLHAFHFSQLDIFAAFLSVLGIIFSKKYLRAELWLISLALFLGPLLTTDTMSFTRYQTISFPLFLYLAHILNGWKYWVVILLFGAGLLLVSILFVNWYWIG